MNKDNFPKFKKGDLITDGESVYLFLKNKNKKEYDIHGRGYWLNGFTYLNIDGLEKFQEYADSFGYEYGEFSLIKHFTEYDDFMEKYKQELKDLSK